VEREFRLPDIGEGLTEAEIVRWLIPEGGTVAADQPVVEVETDKAVVEIPSPFAGVVLRHGGAEGETIDVGEVLVVIGDADSVVAEESSVHVESEPESRDAEPEPPSVAPIVGTLSEEAEVLSPRAVQPGESSPVKALPLVRKLARDRGIDLGSIRGTGPQGRVTREDVLAASDRPFPVPIPEQEPPVAPEPEEMIAEPGPQTPPPQTPPPPPPTQEQPHEPDSTTPPITVVGRGETERRPLSRLRRTIAANMTRSWQEIPHVTTFDEADATRLLEIRDALGARLQTRIPVEALVIKAVLPALDQYPEFNATLDGDDLILHGRHDIGIAVDTPDGLLVAVISDAGSKGVLELAGEVRRLGEGAKGRSLSMDELTGQTFTISNIGAVGGGLGTPIIPFGTTAILSVGRAREKVIASDGDLVIAPLLPLSLSYDHRVIDGAQGRRFMALVLENLEEPALFLAG
jgi:pyruvate dehydrogenase E2 component (dihydrolipoyllysine-residue acetyltransferase)